MDDLGVDDLDADDLDADDLFADVTDADVPDADVPDADGAGRGGRCLDCAPHDPQTIAHASSPMVVKTRRICKSV